MFFRILFAIVLSLTLSPATLGITPKEKPKTEPVNTIIGDTSFVVRFGRLPDNYTDEDLRIKTHLAYVEKLLREKDVRFLPQNLKERRAHNIDLLHEYWTNGIFPSNYDYPNQRKPCFIDREGRICAAGYLVEKTAGRSLAERINGQYQYAYIYEMQLPELEEWIAQSGLTMHEVAMIQPSYPWKIKLPPPTPLSGKAGLAIITNAADAEVIINEKLKFKTNSMGVLTPIYLNTELAVIVVQHPDFLDFTKIVSLKIGRSERIELTLISKYGTLMLGGIPEQAQIFIDDVEMPGKRKVLEESGAGIDRNKKLEQVTFPRIPTGEHKITIKHPDYLDWEGTINVESGGSPGTYLIYHTYPTYLAPAVHLATAQLYVSSKDYEDKASLRGAMVYLDDKELGEVSWDGVLEIKNLKPKEYTIRVAKNGFIEWKDRFLLAIGPNELEVKLLPIPNSPRFDEDFKSGLGKWRAEESPDAPPEWKAENIKGGDWLVVQGSPKLGFPKDSNYHDFNTEFTFQMPNGRGIAWAVRVHGTNNNNYYLFYLSGPQGKFPNQFRTYISKNGNFDLSKPESTPTYCIVTLSPEYLYTVRIEARGNTINTSIKPETDPKTKGHIYPIGFFKDEYQLFYNFGNFGFRTIDGEEVMIKELHITPVEGIEKK